VAPVERVREARDELELLRGGEGSHARCRAAFNAYEREADRPEPDPVAVAAARERLRAAYEAIPEHLRAYVGDMDSKDWPIRRALGLTAEDDD
jgi:hypothetical protein